MLISILIFDIDISNFSININLNIDSNLNIDINISNMNYLTTGLSNRVKDRLLLLPWGPSKYAQSYRKMKMEFRLSPKLKIHFWVSFYGITFVSY